MPERETKIQTLTDELDNYDIAPTTLVSAVFDSEGNGLDGILDNKQDKDKVYDKETVDRKLIGKQNRLVAGENITINGNIISASGDSSGVTDVILTDIGSLVNSSGVATITPVTNIEHTTAENKQLVSAQAIKNYIKAGVGCRSLASEAADLNDVLELGFWGVMGGSLPAHKPTPVAEGSGHLVVFGSERGVGNETYNVCQLYMDHSSTNRLFIRYGEKMSSSASWNDWTEVGGSSVDDVKVDGTSVVTNKIANIDLTDKQDKADNTLATTSKQVVGAINELNTNKVNKTTTIAGIDLQDNITKVELQTALDFDTKVSSNYITNIWFGTQEEFDAIVDKDDNVEYNIVYEEPPVEMVNVDFSIYTTKADSSAVFRVTDSKGNTLFEKLGGEIPVDQSDIIWNFDVPKDDSLTWLFNPGNGTYVDGDWSWYFEAYGSPYYGLHGQTQTYAVDRDRPYDPTAMDPWGHIYFSFTG